MGKNKEIEVVCSEAVAKYLIKRWPFRTLNSHRVRVRIVIDAKRVSATGSMASTRDGTRFSRADLVISTGALEIAGIDDLLSQGRIVLHAEKVLLNDYYAVWAEQSRGYNLKVVRGHVIGGQFIAEESEEKAFAIAARAAKAA